MEPKVNMNDEQTCTATDRFHSEAVVQSDWDENVGALRYWVWAAVQQLGGRMIIRDKEFFATPGDATLHWDVNPWKRVTTVVANRGEDPATEQADPGRCRCCGGSGLSWGEICVHCDGSGSDSEKDHVDCPSRFRRGLAGGLFRTALALGRVASMAHRCRSHLLGWG